MESTLSFEVFELCVLCGDVCVKFHLSRQQNNSDLTSDD